MRMLPIAYYAYQKFQVQNLKYIVSITSDETHPNQECKDVCFAYVKAIHAVLDGKGKTDVAGLVWDSIGKEIVHEDNGVARTTLLQAVDIFLKANSIEEALLAAVNTGWDTDTLAAITGSLAGTFYGLRGKEVPGKWVDKLAQKTLLKRVIGRFVS